MSSITTQLCTTPRCLRWLHQSSRSTLLASGKKPNRTVSCHLRMKRDWPTLYRIQTRSFHETTMQLTTPKIILEDHEQGGEIQLQPQNHTIEYTPAAVVSDLTQAAQWNQGATTWDPQFCSKALHMYEQHLRYILQRLEQHPALTQNSSQEDSFGDIAQRIHPDSVTVKATKELLSSSTAEKAFKAVLKMKIHTSLLSKRVRELERLIGSIRLTPITDTLSFRLLEANAKAGNVGRTLALLNLRKAKGYPPSTQEFEHAIRSLQSAALYLRCNRNVFIMETDQPEIDNPTRWLDAILINMSARNFPLSTELANRMLDCYAQTGRSGKAQHFFYKVSNPTSRLNEQTPVQTTTLEQTPTTTTMSLTRKAKVRMKFNSSPPYYKLMSEVKLRGGKVHLKNPTNTFNPSYQGDSITKADMEKDRHWSLPLTAAFAFADSLTFGACGHKAIQLDLTSWNTLIKVCCYRGSLWRAVEILNETMPRHGIQPDTFTYNTILSGFARVGDTTYMRELLTTMTNKQIHLDKYTIQAFVDGYLNTGDISGAITLVQDIFNQHQMLPPYTSHLKIIEFSLGYELLFEAKRHVYFIQQLWKWKPSAHDSEEFRKMMHLTVKNPKLSKAAIQKLFQYFGENLDLPE